MDNIMMSNTVAIIGCITGCAGLFISLYKAYLERGKLSFDINRPDSFYFSKIAGNEVTKNQAAIRVVFFNRSIYPVTMYSVDLKVNKMICKPRPFNSETIKVPSDVYILGDSPVTLEIDVKNDLVLPYIIPPFGIYCGTLFFPRFPDCDGPVRVKLTFFTTRKKKLSKRFLLNKWDPLKFADKVNINDCQQNH